MRFYPLLTACGGNDEGSTETGKNGADLGDKDITLVSDTYVEAEASTYLAKQALEKVGYNVKVTDVDLGPMFASIADGSGDASLTAWLPNTHKEYWDKYSDQIEKVGTVIDEAPLGLVVPDYMEDITSIEDLADNKNNIGDKLEWKITGVSPGAGQMKMTEQDVMPSYGLDDKWELIESSDAGMSSALAAAIEKKEPIVVTLWYPHWAFQRWDLRLLDDPKNEYGDPDAIYSIGRKGLKEDFPAAYKILSQFHIELEDNEAVMDDLEKNVDPDEAAQNYLDDHPELMDKWLDGVGEE
ncbi:glycine betaine ABC transporter substrate-binding protein [Lentibacillus sp. N15]|uniref:glycine betaine ABC transporter substrate-binding protein n=1 Tax=Lentibacillus songyuanensis TaxID=3136161 RepID=UPI0031BB38A6